LETFDAATSEDINEFLDIIKSVDKDFDVEEFMDKKKPYHYTPDLKSFIDSHVTFTHYAITFKRHGEMDLDFLIENAY
jgi:protein associated with RNAse G/E